MLLMCLMQVAASYSELQGIPKPKGFPMKCKICLHHFMQRCGTHAPFLVGETVLRKRMGCNNFGSSKPPFLIIPSSYSIFSLHGRKLRNLSNNDSFILEFITKKQFSNCVLYQKHVRDGICLWQLHSIYSVYIFQPGVCRSRGCGGVTPPHFCPKPLETIYLVGNSLATLVL